MHIKTIIFSTPTGCLRKSFNVHGAIARIREIKKMVSNIFAGKSPEECLLCQEWAMLMNYFTFDKAFAAAFEYD